MAAGVLLVAAACGGGVRPKPAAVIGEVYAGPARLNIRSDIPLQSAVIATVKHGDRLEILGRRRRFIRVRTPSGAEGWTDERQLLSAEEMAGLRDLAARAAKMPVQGQASTYGDLNVHTQAARQSPSFLQIKEGEKADVLMHVTMPRTELRRKPLIPPAEKKAKTISRKPKKEPAIPPLPMPKPPGPPANWLELSKSDPPEVAEPAEDEVEEKPVPTDDWSLVRVASGQSGWVLTRRLVMSIPDEVAQYAEGHRIVSYAALASVDDGGEKKNTWLWTTIGNDREPHDFDSFRVFVWGLRKHRYETAYIERNWKGYLPMLLEEVEFGASGKTAKYPGFSVCVEKKDGQRYRRAYALLGNIVRFAGETPCEAPETPGPVSQAAPVTGAPKPAPPADAGFAERVKTRVKGWLGRK